MELLVTALLDLAHELPALPRPVLVAGGFGLYLKQRHLEEQTEIETVIPGELWPPARATQDVDLLLPTEVIVSVEHARAIREALDRLGYAPEVKFFQFVKHTAHGPVRIDLLTCDVREGLADKVRIKSMRVRPKGDVQLHAYLTREALEAGLSPTELVLGGKRSDGASDELRVFIPNSFTYLLMKLHAFRDRVDDERKRLAAHHALDVYRIVAMMTEDEYDLVRELSQRHASSPHVLAAGAVVRDRFGHERSTGMMRLLTGAEEAGLARRDVRGEVFREVLGELFPSRGSERVCESPRRAPSRSLPLLAAYRINARP